MPHLLKVIFALANFYFPVTKSFLSQEALAQTIAAAYGFITVRSQLIAAFMRIVLEGGADYT
jgi:hypothetical protein